MGARCPQSWAAETHPQRGRPGEVEAEEPEVVEVDAGAAR